jgi:hypothetical protein
LRALSALAPPPASTGRGGLSPGRGAVTRPTARQGASPARDSVSAVPATPEQQPPPPTSTPPVGTTPAAARRGSRALTSTAPATNSPAEAVDMFDLEQMKQRRKNRARTPLRSSGAGSGAEPVPAEISISTTRRIEQPEEAYQQADDGMAAAVAETGTADLNQLQAMWDNGSSSRRTGSSSSPYRSSSNGRASGGGGGGRGHGLSPERERQREREFSPRSGADLSSRDIYSAGTGAAVRVPSPSTRLSERARGMHTDRSSPRRSSPNRSGRLSPGRSATRAKELRSQQSSPRPWHSSSKGGAGGGTRVSPGRSSNKSRASTAEFLGRLSSIGSGGSSSSRPRTNGARAARSGAR